jgi:hypothetical protein
LICSIRSRMLFWIESSRSRSKVAVPASAKSSSKPASPVRSDWVFSKTFASISSMRSSSSARSSSRRRRISSISPFSNLAGRAGEAFLGVTFLSVIGGSPGRLPRRLGTAAGVAGESAGWAEAACLRLLALAALSSTTFLRLGGLAALRAVVFLLAPSFLVVFLAVWGVFFAVELLVEVFFGAVFLLADFFAMVLFDVVFEAEDLDVDGFLAGLMGTAR